MIRAALPTILASILVAQVALDKPTEVTPKVIRPQATEDLQEMQGTWNRIHAQVNNIQSSGEGWTATYEGDRLTLRSKGAHHRSGIVTIDPGRRPKAMNTWDLDGPNEDVTIPGIYEIDGDEMKVCFARAGEKRPKTFGDGHVYYIYKRAKP